MAPKAPVFYSHTSLLSLCEYLKGNQTGGRRERECRPAPGRRAYQAEVSMTRFLFFGTYTDHAIDGIDAKRTKLAADVVEGFGGQVLSVHALLGRADIVIIADLPGVPEAMQVSLSLYKKIGIRFTSHPALPVAEFDRLASELT